LREKGPIPSNKKAMKIHASSPFYSRSWCGSDANEARCQGVISRRLSAAARSSTKLAKAKKAMEKRGRMKLSGPPLQLIWWAETNENQSVMYELRAA
jgi:hypothetical protein